MEWLSVVLASWVIDDTAAGIGIRESFSPATDNLSCFVPHYSSEQVCVRAADPSLDMPGSVS
jgi:hypothetical protein